MLSASILEHAGTFSALPSGAGSGAYGPLVGPWEQWEVILPSPGVAPWRELSVQPEGRRRCLSALGAMVLWENQAGRVKATVARAGDERPERVVFGGVWGREEAGKRGRWETKERARQGEAKSSRLLNPFCFDFPPSHTAARVQTDAVISILMHFRGPCPNCFGNQKSRVYLQLSP